MTMANSTVTSPSRSAVSLRKTNKPLMEKRRRARINDSLSQLKSLVVQGSKKDSSQFNKLEKADILELTVKHLRNLQNQQQQQQQQQHMSNNDPNLAGKYVAGFMECANEVIKYLGQSQSFNDDTKARVIGHLANCIQLANKPMSKPMPPSNNMTAPSVNTIPSGIPAQATTHLPNGQIVHIVNTPFPTTVQASVVNPLPVQQVNGASSSSSPSSSLQVSSTTIPAVSSAQTSAAQQQTQPQYVRYTQPLHIQIPPVISPVLVRPAAAPSHAQEKVAAHAVPQVPQSHIPAPTQQPTAASSTPTKSHHHIHKQPHQETAVTSTSPASRTVRERSLSPIPQRKPQRNLNFYLPAPEDTSVDYIPRSRTYSVTSSSSDSDLTSPLNLSQSPQYLQDMTPKDSSQDFHHSSLRFTHKLDKKNSPNHQLINDTVFTRYYPAKFTSVIVDGRNKYSNMDEDRPCNHSEGSTSPASSVGEERLWRPW